MGKTIVVTGGTKGIGRAIIQKFAENGYNIITCARNENDLGLLKTELNAFPIEVVVIPADLSLKNDQLKFVNAIQDSGYSIDVLVNNTGIYIPGQIFDEEDGMLERQIDTNLYSAYHITRGIIPIMMQKKSGDVFNICSTASIVPYVNGGSYCISKYALYGMTKVLREEMKDHGIRVTAVLPGATKTASWEGTELPDERFMKPEDVAEAIYTTHSLSKNSVVEEILIRPQLGDLG